MVENFLPKLQRVKNVLAETNVDTGGLGGTQPLVSADKEGGKEERASQVISRIWEDSWGTSMHAWTEIITHANDPIRSLAGYGQNMIGAGISMIGVIGVTKAADAWSGGVWGLITSFSTGGTTKALTAFASFVGSIMLVVAAWLIGTGGLLAYYIPVIPFVYWTLAVLGWAVMFFGSLLAAPLWAASHAVPEGEGFAGRYALQGWQLLVNVLIRPILLVIGLLVSMFVMRAIVGFALKGYAVFNQAMVNSTSSTAITGFLFTNLIMTILTIVLAQKAHELIYDIADSVMKWIGFGVAPLGEVKAEGEVKGMAKGMTGGTERMVGAGVGRLGGNQKGTNDTTDGKRPDTNKGKSHGGRGGGGGDGGDAGEVSGAGEASQRESKDNELDKHPE